MWDWIIILLGVLIVALSFLETYLLYRYFRLIHEKCHDKKPPTPQAPQILETKEGETMDMFMYKFALPDAGAHDVVTRELHFVVNGVEEVVELTDLSVAEFEKAFEQDAEVVFYLIDIDDAGNRSAEGTPLVFHVIDTVPPAAPAAPTILDVVEVVAEAEEPVVEEPVAEEPVVEEPVVEEPVVEEPVAEEPVAEEPVAEEPVVEEPVVEEPVVEEPVAEEPVVEEPVAEEPVVEEPVAEEVPPVEEVIDPEPTDEENTL